MGRGHGTLWSDSLIGWLLGSTLADLGNADPKREDQSLFCKVQAPTAGSEEGLGEAGSGVLAVASGAGLVVGSDQLWVGCHHEARWLCI